MTYGTPVALRAALEQRLFNRSNETGIALDRLRRRVLFERIVARLEAAEPGRWVLKGGMALEVRLQDDARLTKDIDLGLREDVDDHLAQVEIAKVRTYATKVGLDPRSVIKDGQLVFDATERFSFLHLLNEDLYRGDLTNVTFEAQRKAAAGP